LPIIDTERPQACCSRYERRYVGRAVALHQSSDNSRSGGIGVIGGVRQSPKFLKGSIDELKSHLEDKNAPFGVDLLIPQVGGSARKTNKDYTGGQLPELIDVQ
jgi:hypothetical protein